MSKFFHTIGHVGWMTLNLLAAGALLVADLSVYMNPARFVVPALLGLVFEALLVINILFAISWLFSSRKSWCALSLLLILLSMGNILSTFSHRIGQPEPCERTLKVMTYNTHQCSQLKKAEHNEVLRTIKTSGADIVCLQEYDVCKSDRYLTFDEAKRYLSDVYPYTYYDFQVYDQRHQFGIVVYSKYPLIHKNSIQYESRGNQSNYCDVLVGRDTIRLFNNHLESNSIRNSDLEIQESKEQIKRSTRNILSHMVRAYQYRGNQSQIVSQEIARSPYPVIVCGDMNDVPVSYTYRHISHGLTDSFLSASFGKRGWTFYKSILGVRIDYIFTSPSFRILDAQVLRQKGSDHYPYTCTIGW